MFILQPQSVSVSVVVPPVQILYTVGCSAAWLWLTPDCGDSYAVADTTVTSGHQGYTLRQTWQSSGYDLALPLYAAANTLDPDGASEGKDGSFRQMQKRWLVVTCGHHFLGSQKLEGADVTCLAHGARCRLSITPA